MSLKPEPFSHYHIFLASPGDVSEERQFVRKFFEEYNRNVARHWNVQFVVIDWENYATTGVGRPQELITQQTLERFKDSLALVVGIMGQRFGSPTGRAESGTEEEFNWAINSHQASGFPEIKWFFRQAETLAMPADPTQLEKAIEQWKKVHAFRNRIRDLNNPLFYAEYPDAARFAEIFERDLSLWLAGASRPWIVPQLIQDLDAQPSTLGGKRCTCTPQELQIWVERHQARLANAFSGLQSVQARQVHVPLNVCITPAGALAIGGPRMLTPEDLAPILENSGDHVLLLSGDGGTGKTSQAFAIARWWLAGQPGMVVRLPVLIETSLVLGETLVERVRGWLKGQLTGASETDLEPEMVEALLAAKRLIPIIDHLSELAPASREQLLATMSPGIVLVTSRNDDDKNSFRERPLTHIVLERIALDCWQTFFLDYLRRKGEKSALTDDDLIPAQSQLKRIVGDKPVTVLLAHMFIDDVLANRREGLLADSVPELMLKYVRRLDTPDSPGQRRKEGLVIEEKIVQRALRVIALRSHEQAPMGFPLYQPLEFSEILARKALEAEEPDGLSLTRDEARAVVIYLIEMRLLVQPGSVAGRLRLPLDMLADHLAAAEVIERLEERATKAACLNSSAGTAVWEAFISKLEARSEDDKKRMRGFLLALRDGVMEAITKRAMLIPKLTTDRLARLGRLNPDEEHYRLSVHRARKWMWELRASIASERRDAICKLAAMSASATDSYNLIAVRNIAGKRLTQLLSNSQYSLEERCEAAIVLGLVGLVDPLLVAATEESHHVHLRRNALESLGLAAATLKQRIKSNKQKNYGRRLTQTMDALELFLDRYTINMTIRHEDDWKELDYKLSLLQGASRGIQLACATNPLGECSAAGEVVPMLTLSAINENNGLRIKTEVIRPRVWRLPLPEGESLQFINVAAGEYVIGSEKEEEGRDWYKGKRDACNDVNVEVKRVVRTNGFMLARHPVTQAQWRAVARLPKINRLLNPIPGTYKPDDLWETYAQAGSLPVDSISWYECIEWLSRLNQWLAQHVASLGINWPTEYLAEGLPKLVLPSESQWEVACRANSRTPFHFGDTIDANWANYDAGYSAYGYGRIGPYRQRPRSVGFYGLVNAWGFSDMHGQQLDWCGDHWHPNPIGNGSPDNGEAWVGPDTVLKEIGSTQQDWRLLKGGSWFFFPANCRSALRFSGLPDDVDPFPGVGLRPCCCNIIDKDDKI